MARNAFKRFKDARFIRRETRIQEACVKRLEKKIKALSKKPRKNVAELKQTSQSLETMVIGLRLARGKARRKLET